MIIIQLTLTPFLSWSNLRQESSIFSTSSSSSFSPLASLAMICLTAGMASLLALDMLEYFCQHLLNMWGWRKAPGDGTLSWRVQHVRTQNGHQQPGNESLLILY